MSSQKRLELFTAGIGVSVKRISLVSITVDENKIMLNSYRLVPLAAGIVENGVITEIEVFAQSLRKMLSDWHVGSKFFNLSVPTNDMVAKIIETPTLKKSELLNFFKSDIEEHPVMIKYKENANLNEDNDETEDDILNVSLAYSQTDYDEANDKLRYFLMATPFEFFDSYIKTFGLMEKVLSSFSADLFGVISFLQLTKPLPEEIQFVVYVSDESTELVVVKNLSVYFYHKAQFPSKTILKRPAVMADIISRINIIWMSYQDKYSSDQSIDKIVIVSNSSEIVEVFNENMDNLKEKYSDIPIQILDPLQFIDVSTSNFDREVICRDLYSLIPIIGMCVANKRGYAIPDFLKNRAGTGLVINKKDIFFALMIASMAASMVFFLSILIGYYANSLNTKLSDVKHRIIATSKKSAGIESGQSSTIKSELTVLENILTAKMHRMEHLDTLAELIPSALWLKKVDIKTSAKEVTLIFNGNGSNSQALELFIKNLKEEYDNVQIDMVKISSDGVEFALKCIKGRDEPSIN
ncbi:MAG: hypothetical protein A2X42_07370 [Candidatus Margulisbacteria bacterium GWF2_38_17]|nr:MAG: hypothetical protein A2X42_07370 [Candidatus Margulisbacteria bacterium GWF2_38_17]